MICKDSIESAYCIFHQKWNIYEKSSLEWQKDDIEYTISTYADNMNKELFNLLANKNPEFLHNHTTFSNDLQTAINQLEKMMEKQG